MRSEEWWCAASIRIAALPDLCAAPSLLTPNSSLLTRNTGGTMADKKAASKTAPPIAANRQAHHNYFIHDTYECGIALTGTEVKSIRAGKANLRDSFARIQKGEMYLWNAHISPYEQGNIFNHEPLRTRKLLLHKKEIRKIEMQLKTKGYTLVPLKMYFKHGKVKVEIGVATGKKLYDKREDMAAKAAKRDLDRRIKEQRYD